ncbi:TetR/AcrR family transcriptional regulator [Gellertiella hungarica]|uniref:AcrR family transcriptional regulator n=1 Tax=Gellertiella hungarica TaxID=1572859 RepID=A0A7W6J8G8_9HYPH|nr:TetR/AcrR family transcriptional regulator [Gellertiella hungarica]MBB4066719.1 AcrR family transcriptional regulator [Gellertiella hungarica]
MAVADMAERPVKDRAATAARILAAGKAVLAEDGFQHFGINAVARRAGCDKQLIYRYYGGLNGLMEAIGGDLGDWVKTHIPEDSGGMFLLTYGDLMERLALLYLDALRADPLVRQIAAWELAEESEQVRRLSEARSKALAGWLERMRGSLQPPKGADTATLNALVIAGIQQLVLASVTSGRFAGVSLKSEKDWDKVRGALKRLVHGVYG